MQALDLYANIEEYLDFNEEVSFLHDSILDILLSKKPKTHIDIGCGQGDFCVSVLKNGIKTLGVDLSNEQINIAKKKGIDAKCIDIAKINDKYDCATAVFDVINYLPKEYIKEFIQNIYKLLNNNGYFIFDANTLFGFEDVAQGTLTIDLEDKFIAIDANFEDDALYTDITLFEKKEKHYEKSAGTIKQQYYSKEELRAILESAGFKIEKIQPINLHNFDEDDKEIYICKRS